MQHITHRRYTDDFNAQAQTLPVRVGRRGNMPAGIEPTLIQIGRVVAGAAGQRIGGRQPNRFHAVGVLDDPFPAALADTAITSVRLCTCSGKAGN